MTVRRFYVLYARYSPRPERPTAGERQKEKDENERRKNSCDVQLADLREYVGRLEGAVIVGEYRDDAKSGKSLARRPGLAAALKACKRGHVLLCRDTKRLARNMLDAFALVSQLARRGVIFETLHDGAYDHWDPNKLGMFGMKAVFAEMERLRISIDTQAKMRRHQNNLRRMSDVVPFGYRRDEQDSKRLLPFDDEQETIARIQALHLSYGYRAIGRQLEAEGLFCRGRKWNHKTIARILEREATKAKEQRA